MDPDSPGMVPAVDDMCRSLFLEVWDAPTLGAFLLLRRDPDELLDLCFQDADSPSEFLHLTAHTGELIGPPPQVSVRGTRNFVRCERGSNQTV